MRTSKTQFMITLIEKNENSICEEKNLKGWKPKFLTREIRLSQKPMICFWFVFSDFGM